MKISDIIEIKKDWTYHEDAKGFVTSTEGFWDQTELPIIAVEKRRVSSKRIFSMRLEEEKFVEIACLIYSKKIDKYIVDKTLSVKQILDSLCSLNDMGIYCYSNLPDNPKREWWYLECISMYPSDRYDCRCDNIKEFFKGYNTEGFLV